MEANEAISQIDELIGRLKRVSWRERDGVKEELITVAKANPSDAIQRHLEDARRQIQDLELRWEIDEVLEALQPAPEPEPVEEPEPEEEETPEGPLRMSDLKEVYADPRGVRLFTDKTGKRWFLAQPNPQTGQPMMMELSEPEILQVRQQLMGSPYWNIGAGA